MVRGLIEDFRLGTFYPVLSDVVAAEMTDAPEPVRAVHAMLIGLGAEVLAVDSGALQPANTYQERKILTPKYYYDGLTLRWQVRQRSICSSAGTSGTSCTSTSFARSMP